MSTVRKVSVKVLHDYQICGMVNGGQWETWIPSPNFL